MSFFDCQLQQRVTQAIQRNAQHRRKAGIKMKVHNDKAKLNK